MSNSISVNVNDHAIFNGAMTDVTWDGEVVSGGDYGKILTVDTASDNSYVVKTEKGTLTFGVGSPHLQEAKQDFAPYELVDMYFPEAKGYNWLEIASVLIDAEKLRRKTSRLARQTARDTAFKEATDAAKALRAAAKEVGRMGFWSGVVSCAGGAIGVAGGIGGLSKSIKACKVKTNRTALEADFAVKTQALTNNKARLKTLNAKPNKTKADLDEIAELQSEQQKIQKELAKLDTKLDAQLEQAQKKEAKAEGKRDDALKDAKNAEFELRQAKISRRTHQKNAKDLDNPDSEGAKKLKALEKQEAKAQKNLDKATARLKKADANYAAAKEAAGELRALDNRVTRMRDADVDTVRDWATNAKAAHDQQIQIVQDLMTRVQAQAPLYNGLQGMMGGGAQMLNAKGQAIDAEAQADAREADADVAEANYQQENATEDLQEANRAIQNFLQTWEKMVDSIKAMQDRLVQA